MSAHRERGLTLVELIMFLVIVSLAVVGILKVMTTTTRASADPQVRKQALAVAEALLEEVESMPFTTCDPDGYDVSSGTCAMPEAMGPEAAFTGQPAAEARGNATAPFDNVNDYAGFNLAGGGSDIGGPSAVVVPAGYSASVAVAQDGALGPAASPLAAGVVLRITVTVSYNNNNDSVVLQGYRTQYAPTSMP
ncbi:MAG TPA: type II secretion system protein [Burkholderiaceae bacterium]|nr:type II secretion system protein [Burkholderiaceae bacterium]